MLKIALLLGSLASASAFCRLDKRLALETCADGVKPEKGDDGCPSCKPAWKCRLTEMMKCTRPPPACAEGVSAKRDGCCLSCLPTLPKCNAASKIACKAKMAEDDFPVCTKFTKDTKIKDYFDKATCCPTCKKPPRTGSGKCSIADFKACIEADTTPECAEGEKPQHEKGQCCRTCRRANRGVSFRDIAKCIKSLPKCAAGDEPTKVAGQAGAWSCPSCKRGRPQCTPACADGEVCARSKDDAAPTCRAKRTKRFFWKAKKAAMKAWAAAADEEEIRASLVEMIERYCENSANYDQCVAHKTALIDSIIIRIKKKLSDGDGEEAIEIEVDVGADATTTRRRLLADGATTLLNNAVNAEGGDLTLTEASGSTDPTSPTQPNNSPTSSPNSASSLSFTMAAVAAPLLALLRL